MARRYEKINKCGAWHPDTSQQRKHLVVRMMIIMLRIMTMAAMRMIVMMMVMMGMGMGIMMVWL